MKMTNATNFEKMPGTKKLFLTKNRNVELADQ